MYMLLNKCEASNISEFTSGNLLRILPFGHNTKYVHFQHLIDKVTVSVHKGLPYLWKCSKSY